MKPLPVLIDLGIADRAARLNAAQWLAQLALRKDFVRACALKHNVALLSLEFALVALCKNPERVQVLSHAEQVNVTLDVPGGSRPQKRIYLYVPFSAFESASDFSAWIRREIAKADADRLEALVNQEMKKRAHARTMTRLSKRDRMAVLARAHFLERVAQRRPKKARAS